MSRTEPTDRRSLGSYYTPEWLARAMVARCCDVGKLGTPAVSWRMLDPACGDGAFVLALLESCRSAATNRLELVRERVFGVDADPLAIATLRKRVAEWIEADSASTNEMQRVLETNFVCGDSLLGRSWAAWETESPVPCDRHVPAIDWNATFPHVAAEGGFDLLIGNPPYLRERNAKRDFDRIARSPLGRRWRRARMDLWHYFLHRGLDLLKPGGILCYIVNSYWTGSTAAQPLVARLAAETTMEEIVLLGASRVFRDVNGRHLIFRTRKCVEPDAACQICDLSEVSLPDLKEELKSSSHIRTVSQRDLWRGGRLHLEATPERCSLPERGMMLGEVFEVRQGIAENPPFVTKAIATELNQPQLLNRGVFVLTEAEVESLALSTQEHSLLRPYYALSAVTRFGLSAQPTHRLLYLTKQTAATLDGFPHVAAHLAPYRPVLERRREVASGGIAWWHLHWPREERLFTAPRVLCPQMGREPRFVQAEQPTFVSFSQHVIVERTPRAGDHQLTPTLLSLTALSAILNSSPARNWLETYAKRRGANLDISGTVLKRFPLPGHRDPELEWKLEQLAREWPTLTNDRRRDADARLDRVVERWYRIA